MSPKPDVSEERKHQILDAAIHVFSRDGFHEARMEDIAKEADMSKGALYWYFKSKDEIITNLLGFFFDREFGKLKSWDLESRSPAELLKDYTNLLIEDLDSIKPFLMVAYEFMAMISRNKNVRKVVQKSLNQYIEITVPIIQRGVDEGEFRQLDPYETSLAFGAIIEGSIIIWAYDMERFQLSELISRNLQIFLDGIKNNN